MEFQISQSGILANLPPFPMAKFSFKYFLLINIQTANKI